MTSTRCELLIVGAPLNSEDAMASNIVTALRRSSIFVGETKKATHRFLAKAQANQKNVFCLDNMAKMDWEALTDALTELKKTGGAVSLFSDAGMPILFDPGKKVLEFCKHLKFEIHTLPAATSWGTAAAVSGFDPPFEVIGFLSKIEDERKCQIPDLVNHKSSLILLETPYRFEKFIRELTAIFGTGRPAFLAWEISKNDEKLIWGTLREIREQSEKLGLHKGEFVIVIGSRGAT